MSTLPLITDEPWVPEDTFGSRLALIRNRFGWNVKEAADVCGFNDQSWRNWEAGKHPRDFMATCEKIVEVTGCSMKWLVAGAQNWKKLSTSDLQVLPGGAKAAPSFSRPDQLKLRLLHSVE
jgi:transcriptional regulator with XRE-family HTH domain